MTRFQSKYNCTGDANPNTTATVDNNADTSHPRDIGGNSLNHFFYTIRRHFFVKKKYLMLYIDMYIYIYMQYFFIEC